MDKLRKIRRHHRKECFKIRKIVKFESDLLKTNEDVAPQSREILVQICPHHHHSNVCKFSQLCGALSSLTWDVSLSNLAILLTLRCSLQWYRRIFRNLSLSKVEKTVKRSFSPQNPRCTSNIVRKHSRSLFDFVLHYSSQWVCCLFCTSAGTFYFQFSFPL